MRSRHWNVEVARRLDRLSAIHRFRYSEFSRAILNETRDSIDVFPALLSTHFPPYGFVRSLGSLISSVNVFSARDCDARQNSFRRRIYRIEILSRLRRDKLSADEEIVLRLYF